MIKKILYKKFQESNSKITILFILLFLMQCLNAQNAPLRRPISPDKPMWLIHIDSWNNADPQKIIDMIPKDVLPYVVFNISLSINHDATTGKWLQIEYGYETVKSWLRTCAENQVWAMVQQSSGGFQHFSDFDLQVYEELYRDYPNLIGFNYAEQFWGYDDPYSVSWTQRMAHFTNLLKLSNKYGGYLSVSWCGNQWSPSINPMAMMKRNPDFALACKNYTKNFILCEKYTQQSYQSDMESLCLGAYLSGFSGQYGIRYDSTGWSDATGINANFTMSTGGAAHLEHLMLTGETVIDGPETIPMEQSKEIAVGTTSDNYKTRKWEFYPQFYNVSLDLFRKVLDGTVRIPTRKEVIDRTKAVVIHDINSGTNDDIYSTPSSLFEGLYRMDGDGNLKDNKTFFKKSGRYPTIPTVFQLADTDANSFQLKVNNSAYASRWPAVSAKVTEFNTLFPEEYTGDIYAGRHENAWVVYNPYKTGQTASGLIPFKYNTSESMELSFSQYTSGVVKESANQLNIYLNNYDNVINTGLKTDIIKIKGSSNQPTFSFIDRGNHTASIVSSTWVSGVFTLTIQHNGALDLVVNCSGNATGRLTTFKQAQLIEPNKPSVYTGIRQNEAEFFDYKNIKSNTINGVSGSVKNYQGQGYLNFGTNATASIKDNIKALRKGTYKLNIRYSAPNTAVNNIDLYINGVKIATPLFNTTNATSSWATISQNVELVEGDNEIKLEANSAGLDDVYFDNITFTQNENNGVYNFTNDLATTSASTPAANLITVKSGSAGVVSTADVNNNVSNAFKTYSVGTTNGSGVADLDMFQNNATDYSVTWKEIYTANGGKKGVLLRGTGANGSCPYAVGMKQGYLFIVLNNADGTITLKPYLADQNGITAKPTYTTTTLKIVPGQPAWYRASAIGNKLIFECSADGINWEGANQTTFVDNTYVSGSSELVWGLSSNNFNWVMDDIKFGSIALDVSKFNLEGFSYKDGSGPSLSQTFSVAANSSENMVITAPSDYELSLSANGTYASTITLSQNSGVVPNTQIYVRLKAGLTIGDKNGLISVVSNVVTQQVSLKGKVEELPVFVQYDFTNDTPTVAATTPPANYVTIGQTNTATAGVISYTDADNNTSNVLRPYGVGQRNSTGVMDLNAFSKTATNYSVTWKQYIGSESTQYKVGMLLRGDTGNIGTATTGYVQGIMQGYLLLAFNSGTSTNLRIYRSTSSGLTTLKDVAISTLDPAPNKAVWYRVSVSGTGTVTLNFEYSTDGSTWTTGATATDTGSVYNSGATQVVWGLAVANTDFYMDDIAFSGLDNFGTSVIDDDKDGIPNSTDNCPNTQRGEKVNINGCAQGQLDDDKDGVINSIDTCPNTPLGQTVNASGCAQSQLDDDGDGVKNSVDLCPNTPIGQSVDANGCIVLGSTNYSIEAVGESCPNKNNGQITITASQNLTYSATVNGTSRAFANKVLALNNLVPGTYDICVEASGTASKQCYSIVIPASVAITAKTSSTSDKLHVEIESGTAPYQVSVNGVSQFETNNTNFDVAVNSGDVLKVTTSKLCEGSLTKTITLFDLVRAVPNPTSGPFDIYLPTNDNSVSIEIYTASGTLISKSAYSIENGKVHLDLSNEAAGIYFVKLNSNPVETIKIIKK